MHYLHKNRKRSNIDGRQQLIIFFYSHVTRDISSNPLNCDCRASWMREWMLEREELQPPTCHLPATLRDNPITKVVSQLLTCQGVFREYIHIYCFRYWFSHCMFIHVSSPVEKKIYWLGIYVLRKGSDFLLYFPRCHRWRWL